MALTLRGDGTGTAFLVNSAWWNDYYNLLTGNMTDQPVTLNYRPGSAGSTAALALKTNGNADMVQGFDSAGNQKFRVDTSGFVYSRTYAVPVLIGNGATAGKRIWIGPNPPPFTSCTECAQEGDLFFKG